MIRRKPYVLVQESQLRNSAGRLRQQARQVVAADREELARQALALRTATLAQADDLAAEQTALRAPPHRALHRRATSRQKVLAGVDRWPWRPARGRRDGGTTKGNAPEGW